MGEESELLRTFTEAFEEANRAWNAGDVKTAYAALPDELEYRLSAHWPEARVLRSREEVVEFFEDFQRTFPDARTESHEFLAADDGTVIAGFKVIGSGSASGAGGEMEIWQVWRAQEVDDGLTITSVTEFNDRAAALSEAGLEQGVGRVAE